MGGSRSHSELVVVGKSSQNSPKPVLLFWSGILFAYTLLIVVSYYYVCSVHVSDGFPKKSVNGWGENPVLFWIFLTLQL